MKTLDDYVRGHSTPILIVIESGKYSVCKCEDSDEYYFMKGKEVLYTRYVPGDRTYELDLARINHVDVEEELKKQKIYKEFQKFIKKC